MASVAEASSRRSTHARILQSTAVIGLAGLINIVMSIVRAKAVAVLLGPSGIGLFGVLSSLLDLVHAVGGVGVSSSGVRQIAQANGDGDRPRLALVVATVRLLSVALAVVAAAVVVLGAGPIALVSFGDDLHRAAVVTLSVAVLVRVAAQGESAILQGMRRVGDLARVQIVSGLLATAATVAIVFAYGEDGVAWAVVAAAAAGGLVAWLYSRRVAVGFRRVPFSAVRAEATGLLNLGAAFMIMGLLAATTAYAVRILITRDFGFDAAGLYQAAWTVGGLYAGFVLQAMGTDFYPQLVALGADDRAGTDLINDQIRIGTLVAGPGVCATLTLAPVILVVLYSTEFRAAESMLRWLSLGMMLRVVSWPIGYILIARGWKYTLLAVELTSATVYVALASVLIPLIGVDGAGIAFCLFYLWHTLVVFLVVWRRAAFGWRADTLVLVAAYLACAGGIFAAFELFGATAGLVIGLSVTALASVHSAARLAPLLPVALPFVPALVRRFARG